MQPEQVAALNREDISAHLSEGVLRTHRIIHLAITFAPLLFGAIIVVLKATGASPAERAVDESPTDILLMAIGAVFLGAILVSLALPGLWFKPQALARRLAGRSGDDPARIVSALMAERFTYAIIRLALLEGMAFAGLIVPLLAVLNGTLADEPQAYLGALPLAVHLLAAVATYPSRQAVTAFLYDRMVQPMRRHPPQG